MARQSSTNPDSESLSNNDVQAIQELQETFVTIKSELSRVIIGQDEAIERIFLCILSRGHALLMGVPGLAKTLLVNSIAGYFWMYSLPPQDFGAIYIPNT